MSYTYENDGKVVWLDTAEPDRRFDNMLYNRRYMTMIDHTAAGRGFYQDEQGRVCNVVSNGRVIYIRDDETGEYFSVGFNPVWAEYESYRCGSGLNYQIIENLTNGLKATWRITIPAGDDPVELWDLRVADASGKARKVSVFTMVQMNCDGVDTYGGGLFRIARYEPQVRGIFVRTDAAAHEDMDFPIHNGFLAASREPDGWDANLEKFVGPRRTASNPLGVEQGACEQRIASMWNPTGTMQFKLALDAGASADLRFVIGACAQMDHAATLRDRYMDGSLDADKHFDALAAERESMTANIQVDTPDETINRMVNLWVKQQVHYGATWVRWGYKGYRDIVQQAMGVLTQDPELAREDLLAACRRQYNDGFALRGWHPLDPMRYADSAQWLISSFTEYVKETGDLELMNRTVEYLDEGEGTVYEHLMKAMDRLHTDRGPRGLCLVFFGDWNDSLTGVCKEGKGESVWLSQAFCRCAKLMQELAEALGRTDDARRMHQWHAEMAEAINEKAWDGQWYLCAIDDHGGKIGSNDNDEGKVFLNMQSWAVLGETASADRVNAAFAAVDEHLDTGWGLMLNWPTYTKPAGNIGRLSYLRPGICENGSVYTHGNAFMILALLQSGRADRAWRLWREVHPGNPDRPMPSQPNVFANGYYGPDSDIAPGRAEHMWVTGSAGWMFYNIVEYMLGLRRTYDGLVIRPCLPSEWTDASITRTFRGTTYRVSYSKPAGVENPSIESIAVDGADHPADQPLPIDGGDHEVKVTLK